MPPAPAVRHSHRQAEERRYMTVNTVANRDVREQFARTAAAYRRRRLHLAFLFVPLLLVFWYLVFFAKAPALAVPVFAICFAGLLLAKRITPKLICPGCECDVDCETVRFCPECGSSDVQMKGDDHYFLLWPTCKTCKAELRKRKGGRVYKIRFCTRCGAHLDERGV